MRRVDIFTQDKTNIQKKSFNEKVIWSYVDKDLGAKFGCFIIMKQQIQQSQSLGPLLNDSNTIK